MTLRTISGYVTLSPQMLREAQMSHCSSDASDVYALTGRRIDCTCGHHDGLAPIAPLLLMSDDEYAARTEQMERDDE